MSSHAALRSRPAAIFLLCLLAGCHLIDQRDFDRNAGKPPAKPVVAAGKPPPSAALLTIVYDRPDPSYAQELANAVQAALARKPDVLFTVETTVPVTGGPDAQAEQATQGAATGRQVAEAIIADGANQGQIELAVRADPARQVKQVQVIVH
jgi:hypothetical protein